MCWVVKCTKGMEAYLKHKMKNHINTMPHILCKSNTTMCNLLKSSQLWSMPKAHALMHILLCKIGINMYFYTNLLDKNHLWSKSEIQNKFTYNVDNLSHFMMWRGLGYKDSELSKG